MSTQGFVIVVVVVVGVLAGFAGASSAPHEWEHAVAVAARTSPDSGGGTASKNVHPPSSAVAPTLIAPPPQSGADPAPRRDLRALMGPVRTMPVTRNGKIAGFRLSGMRPGTLLPLLGIQNGDVIESFDGKDVSTPERALQAYAVLMDRTAERLSLGIRRRGAPVTITYRIN